VIKSLIGASTAARIVPSGRAPRDPTLV